METTVDLAVEHMCSWKQLINSMGNLWDEEQFRFHSKESIKEALIREIKAVLSFSVQLLNFQKKGKRNLWKPWTTQGTQQFWKPRMDRRGCYPRR